MLMFTFRSDVPIERQDRLLDRIQQWGGVTQVARLSPNEARPELHRFAYLRLASDVSPSRVLSKLRKLPEIESAEPPAARHPL